MKKLHILSFIIISLLSCGKPAEKVDGKNAIVKAQSDKEKKEPKKTKKKNSPYITLKTQLSAEEVVKNLKAGMEKRNLKIFSEVSHHEGAKKVGEKLAFTHLIIFGKPEVGTKLMLCDQSIGLKLPLKILVYTKNEKTVITYEKPFHFNEQHKLGKCKEVLKKIDDMLKGLTKEAVNTK